MTMSARLTVSVALCTHNGARFIGEQLDSIFAQTVIPDEIVISDDASTDGTLEIASRAFENRPGPPVLTVLENNPALGVTKNFEKAILACASDIVVLSDQDDRWQPYRVERTLIAFDDPVVVLVHSDAGLIGADGDVLPGSLFQAYSVDAATRSQLASNRAFDLFMRRNLVTGATMAVRRTFATVAAPFPESWVHDEWLAIVAALSGRLAPLDERLIEYRQHGSNEIGAVEVNLAAKVARLTAPGFERNRRLLRRATELAARLREPGVPAMPEHLVSADAKVQHELARSALSPHRLARVAPVIREWRTGRYTLFGGGLQDVARDLVQPLKPPS